MPEFAEVHRQVCWLRERVEGWSVRSWGVRDGTVTWGTSSSAVGDQPPHEAQVRLRPGSHFPDLGAEPAARAAATARLLDGARIARVTQRGKYVLFVLSTGVVASHLMFRGRWSVAGDDFVSPYKHHKTKPTAAANSLWLECDRGRLNFHDPESKGHARGFHGVGPSGCPPLAALGPDVIQTEVSEPEAAAVWELAALQAGLARARQTVKAFLLDQKRQAGLGNMYACEAMYRAGVRPDREPRSLSRDEATRLYTSARDVVRASIDSGLDYAATLAVYGRTVDPHGRPVVVSQLDGRDTYWVREAQT